MLQEPLASTSSGEVSVVIAAYNSARRLEFAVRSALRQDHPILEVIVVGDCCTDDTEAVLQSIGDPRIRWVNLPRNWGEQSVPSNRGIELARGEFLFFLNQDDIWLDDHVRSSLALLQGDDHDIVWSPYLIIPPGSKPSGDGSPAPCLQGGGAANERFDPYLLIPASCVAWRTSALRKLGGWRSAAEVTVSPSQDLLWRAHREGLSMIRKPNVSVLVLWSGARRGAYSPHDLAVDHASWFECLVNNTDRIGAAIIGAPSCIDELAAQGRVGYFFRKAASRLIGRMVAVTGRHPRSLENWLRYRKSDGFINHVRASNDLSRRDFRKAAKVREEA